MRAAQLNEESIVINVIIVPYIDFLPNLVEAEEAGNIGDFWSGTEFIGPTDPRHPYYVPPEQ